MEDKLKYAFNGILAVKPQVAGEHLKKLTDENGGKLTPEIVLKSAKKKSDALHTCFEWNDSVAANKFRREQARLIIRGVQVIKLHKNEEIKVGAFVSIRHDVDGNLSTNPFAKGDSHFVTVDSAMASNVLQAYTLEMALIELQNFQNKYHNLKELKDVFASIKFALSK
jgi:hypothetical protein